MEFLDHLRLSTGNYQEMASVSLVASSGFSWDVVLAFLLDSYERVERGRSRGNNNVRQRRFGERQTEHVMNLLRWVTSGPPL